MANLASIIQTLQVGDVVDLTEAVRVGGGKMPTDYVRSERVDGDRLLQVVRARVNWVNTEPRLNHRGVAVVGFGFAPAEGEPMFCGHGCYHAALDGAEPRFGIVEIVPVRKAVRRG